ncbi:MAG: hypothetical protein Q9216_005860 [Gyalolechia sp. 2 TL-2023]
MSAMDSWSQALDPNSVFVKSLNLAVNVTHWFQFEDLFHKTFQEVRASWASVTLLEDRYERALHLETNFLRSYNEAAMPAPSLCHEFEQLRIKFQARFDALMELQTTILMSHARNFLVEAEMTETTPDARVRLAGIPGREAIIDRKLDFFEIKIQYDQYFLSFFLETGARRIQLHDSTSTDVLREDYWEPETLKWVVKRQDR